MSKHTKGPWKSQHESYSTWVGDQRWISVTAPKRGEIGRFKRDADAVLASAAPELLEALQAVVQYGAMTGDDWVEEKVLAAISKAIA